MHYTSGVSGREFFPAAETATARGNDWEWPERCRYIGTSKMLKLKKIYFIYKSCGTGGGLGGVGVKKTRKTEGWGCGGHSAYLYLYINMYIPWSIFVSRIYLYTIWCSPAYTSEYVFIYIKNKKKNRENAIDPRGTYVYIYMYARLILSPCVLWCIKMEMKKEKLHFYYITV